MPVGRFAPSLALALLVACGDKDTTSGDTSASVDDTAADTASGDDTGSASTGSCPGSLGPDSGCVDYDGNATDLPIGSAWIGQGSYAGFIPASFSQDGYNAPPAITILIPDTSSVGTQDCSAARIALWADDQSWSAESALAYYGSDCSLTLTAFGANVGDPVEGYFTADMYGGSDWSLIPVSGEFTTSVMF